VECLISINPQTHGEAAGISAPVECLLSITQYSPCPEERHEQKRPQVEPQGRVIENKHSTFENRDRSTTHHQSECAYRVTGAKRRRRRCNGG